MSDKDILDGEICELIAAQSVERGFKSEWLLTLRYETHTFEVKAFAEHGRMLAVAGIRLPERFEGKREFMQPYDVILGYDETHQARRIVGVLKADGQKFLIADYIQRQNTNLDMAIEIESKDRENRRLAGELAALRNSIANGSIGKKQSPMEALKSSLDTLLVQYPHDSIERGLVANMLMSHAVLSGDKPLVAQKRAPKSFAPDKKKAEER